MLNFKECLKTNPCIAILRGLDINDACAIADLIYRSGIRIIEVPLNKPGAVECIVKLLDYLPQDCLIGAGTVVTEEQVKLVYDIGGSFIISPNTSKEIITLAISHHLLPIPGVASVTEACIAYEYGARYLKLFPASSYDVKHMNAIRSVMPDDVSFIPVGGVNASNMGQWLQAGALGVGLGNVLFQSGESLKQVELKLASVNSALANYNNKSHLVTL